MSILKFLELYQLNLHTEPRSERIAIPICRGWDEERMGEGEDREAVEKCKTRMKNESSFAQSARNERNKRFLKIYLPKLTRFLSLHTHAYISI